MVKPFHPDDTGLLVNRHPGGMNGGDDGRLPPKNRNNNNDGGGQRGLLSPYGPGGLGLLSSQLAQGFGGSPKHWANFIGQSYSPMQMPQQFEYGIDVPGEDNPNDTNPKPDGGLTPNGVYPDKFGRNDFAILGGAVPNMDPRIAAILRARANKSA
jgi:hypothetical protein